MEKIDFDILLKPVNATILKKDIALVDTIASIAQQIKNIVLLGENEIPFSEIRGVGLKDYFYTDKSKIFLLENIETKIANSVKNIFNISVSLQETNNTTQQVIVIVKFDYISKMLNKKNNIVRIQVDI